MPRDKIIGWKNMDSMFLRLNEEYKNGIVPVKSFKLEISRTFNLIYDNSIIRLCKNIENLGLVKLDGREVKIIYKPESKINE